MKRQLSFANITYILLLGVGLFGHVEIIPAVLSSTGRDSWISILVAFIPLLIVIPMLLKINQISKNQFIMTLKSKTNAFIYYLLLFPIGLYFLISSFITAKEIVYWSQLSFMQGFSSFIISFTLLAMCLYCTKAGITPLSILSSILLPAVVFLGFFVSFANIKKKNYELLFPILENGISPIFEGLLYTSLPILELTVILFLVPSIKKNINGKKLLLLGLLIIGLMCGPAIAAIVEFGPDQAAAFRYPAYEEWRIISVGRYFAHTDFFAIFQWLSGGVVRISLYIYISMLIFFKGQMSTRYLHLVYVVFFIGCMWGLDQNIFYLIVFNYFLPVSSIILLLQLFIILLYMYKNKKVLRGET